MKKSLPAVMKSVTRKTTLPMSSKKNVKKTPKGGSAMLQKGKQARMEAKYEATKKKVFGL